MWQSAHWTKQVWYLVPISADGYQSEQANWQAQNMKIMLNLTTKTDEDTNHDDDDDDDDIFKQPSDPFINVINLVVQIICESSKFNLHRTVHR
jgi:hypothetical protein